MDENVKWELNEIRIQLSGMRSFSDDNADKLIGIYEDRFEPAVLQGKTNIDRSTLSFMLIELNVKTSLAVNSRSIKIRKENYNNAIEQMLFNITRILK
jgi:hypothetical protein